MKNTLTALALALLSTGTASAQVQLVVVSNNGSVANRVKVDDIRRISFPGEGNSFALECIKETLSYGFDDVRCLKFEGLVNDISAAAKPVSDLSISYSEGLIYVNGLADTKLRATIYDLNGCSRVSLPNYDGQPIDVTQLPKGAYILRIGGKAFKFLR